MLVLSALVGVGAASTAVQKVDDDGARFLGIEDAVVLAPSDEMTYTGVAQASAILIAILSGEAMDGRLHITPSNVPDDVN